MSTTNLPAIIERNMDEFNALLVQNQDELIANLQGSIDLTHFVTVAMQMIKSNSGLLKCADSPEGRHSLLSGCFEASQLHLSLNRNLRHAWLVPRKNGALSKRAGKDIYEATFQIGAYGLLFKAQEANPDIQTIYSKIVWPGEVFEIDESQHMLHHRPDPRTGGEITVETAEQNNGNYTFTVPIALHGFDAVYCRVIYKSGAMDFESMTKREVEKRWKASPAAASPEGPWIKWTEDMVLLKPMIKLCKRLKLSETLTAAITRSEYRDAGVDTTAEAAPEPPRLQMPRRRELAPAIETTATHEDAEKKVQPENTATATQSTEPMCPQCGGKLRTRKGKTGTFYGCTRYPECTGTLSEKAYNEAKAKPVQAEPTAAEEPADGMTEAAYKEALEGFRKLDLGLVKKVAREQEFSSEFHVPSDPMGRLLAFESFEKAFAGKQ